MKIIADNTIPFLRGKLEAVAEVHYIPSNRFTATELRDADVLVVRSIDKCTREVLDGSKVRLITTATIGYDHIDTDWCDKAGIVWRNAPGSNARSVAEYLLASLVVLAMKTGESLAGKVMGIIGVGHVGKQVEQLCTAMGMQILRNDPPRAEKEGSDGFVDLATIARKADVITVHTPLTKEGKWPAYHLMNQSFFASLKRSPWFINAARGAIVDTNALIAAIKSGRISRLVMDCWEGEPLINRELLQMTDMATPHIAGFSADGKANATRMCLEAIAEFYGIDIPGMQDVLPPPPSNPLIDLRDCAGDQIYHAILQVFNPLLIDRQLRLDPDKFEYFRANYAYPREFNAYSVSGADDEVTMILRKLGFDSGRSTPGI